MKLDQETLVKQHFWFLLGLVGPLVLIALIVLWTGAASVVAEGKKAIDSQKNTLEGIIKAKDPKNDKWMEALRVKSKAAEAQRDKIWEKAWSVQAPFFTWPPDPAFNSLRTAPFGKPIDPDIASKFPDVYQQLYDDMPAIVRAVNEKGEGEVQLAGGPDAILHPLTEWKVTPPSSAELWLLMENVWVQRALLQTIRDANDTVARLFKRPNPPKPDTAKNELDRQVFFNGEWELDLTLLRAEGGLKLRTRLTNVSSRRQSLGLAFEVRYPGSQEPQYVIVDGEPLAPNAFYLKEHPLPAGVGFPDKIDSAVQVFDWRTAPVKRIDKLVLGGAQSSRTYSKPLLPPRFMAQKAESPAGGNARPGGGGGGASGQNISGGMNTPGVGGGGAMGGGGGRGAADSTRTENGVEINRYIDISEQVRRMPVGMVLIVDQSHIQEVLTAIANSPLRIETTQWHWRRFHGDIKPPVDKAPSRPTRPTRGVRAAGRVNIGGAGAVARAIREDQDWELVELAVYGIASLYEHFPPESSAETAAKPAAPGAPGVPGGGNPGLPR